MDIRERQDFPGISEGLANRDYRPHPDSAGASQHFAAVGVKRGVGEMGVDVYQVSKQVIK
jgi:hypothetical protein